jgi:hypothetical protein
MKRGTRVYFDDGCISGIVVKKDERGRVLMEVCKGSDRIECKSRSYYNVPKEYYYSGTNKYVWINNSKNLTVFDTPMKFYMDVHGLSASAKREVFALLDEKGWRAGADGSVYEIYSRWPDERLDKVTRIAGTHTIVHISSIPIDELRPLSGYEEVTVRLHKKFKTQISRSSGGIKRQLKVPDGYITTIVWNPIKQKYEEQVTNANGLPVKDKANDDCKIVMDPKTGAYIFPVQPKKKKVKLPAFIED